MTARRALSPRALTVGGAALVVAIALILSQALLPSIAASRLRSSLSGVARGVHVSVQATPALKLLLGEADKVTLRIGRLRANGRSNLSALLDRSRASTDVYAHVAQLITGSLDLADITFVKQGSRLRGSLDVSRAAVDAALPFGLTTSVSPAAGDALTLSARVKLLGATLQLNAYLEARDGDVQIVPESSLLPALTVFSDPTVSVDALRVATSGQDYIFAAAGHFR
jgi:hypothetical protein